jgi:hypothetical protein
MAIVQIMEKYYRQNRQPFAERWPPPPLPPKNRNSIKKLKNNQKTLKKTVSSEAKQTVC